jgi:hypothetical protein
MGRRGRVELAQALAKRGYAVVDGITASSSRQRA